MNLTVTMIGVGRYICLMQALRHAVQDRQQREAQQRTDRLLQEVCTQQRWDVQGIHAWLRKELQSQVRARSIRSAGL